MRILAIILALTTSARAATVISCFTNSLGQPDTNAVRFFPITTPIAVDGSWFLTGVPIRAVPSASGFSTNTLMQGNWFLTNQFLGQGIIIAVPTGSGTYNAARLKISGGNTYNYTPGVLVLTSTNGSVTVSSDTGVVDLSVSGIAGNALTNDYSGGTVTLNGNEFHADGTLLLSAGQVFIDDGGDIAGSDFSGTFFTANSFGGFIGSGAGLTGIPVSGISGDVLTNNRAITTTFLSPVTVSNGAAGNVQLWQSNGASAALTFTNNAPSANTNELYVTLCETNGVNGHYKISKAVAGAWVYTNVSGGLYSGVNLGLDADEPFVFTNGAGAVIIYNIDLPDFGPKWPGNVPNVWIFGVDDTASAAQVFWGTNWSQAATISPLLVQSVRSNAMPPTISVDAINAGAVNAATLAASGAGVVSGGLAVSNGFLVGLNQLTNGVPFFGDTRKAGLKPTLAYSWFHADATRDSVRSRATNVYEIVLRWQTNGMAAAGWNTLLISDGWAASDRNPYGYMYERSWFTNGWPGGWAASGGMPNFVKLVRAAGFKPMFYTAFPTEEPGSTCLGSAGTSFSTVQRDMQLFASWGADWVFADICGSSPYGAATTALQPAAMRAMANSITRSGRAIGLFSLAANGWSGNTSPIPNEFTNALNGIGITGTFDSLPLAYGWSNAVWAAKYCITNAYTTNIASFWGPGCHPEFANYATGQDPTNASSYMAMLAMLSAHALISTFTTDGFISQNTGDVQWLTNSEAIAINQDDGGRPFYVCSSNNLVEVFAKALGPPGVTNGWAISMVNYSTSVSSNATLAWGQLATATAQNFTIRDVMNLTNFPGQTNTSFTFSAPKASATLFTLTPVSGTNSLVGTNDSRNMTWSGVINATGTGSNFIGGFGLSNQTLYAQGTAGTSGQVLTSGGAGAADSWSTVSGGSGAPLNGTNVWTGTNTFSQTATMNSNLVANGTVTANGTVNINTLAVSGNGTVGGGLGVGLAATTGNGNVDATNNVAARAFSGRVGSNPTIVTNTGGALTVGCTVTLNADATDTRGIITVNTGSGTAAALPMFTINWTKPWTTTNYVFLQNMSYSAGNMVGRWWVSNTAAASTVWAGSVAPTINTNCVWAYWVMQ